MTICKLCRQQPAIDGKYCNDCGAELHEQWKADRDVAECDAAVAQGDVTEGPGTPDPDLPF